MTFELTVVLRLSASSMQEAVRTVEDRLQSGRTEAGRPQSDPAGVLLAAMAGKVLAPRTRSGG